MHKTVEQILEVLLLKFLVIFCPFFKLLLLRLLLLKFFSDSHKIRHTHMINMKICKKLVVKFLANFLNFTSGEDLSKLTNYRPSVL